MESETERYTGPMPIDYTVLASSADPTPGYLSDKVDGTTIEVVNNKLVAQGAGSTFTVKASATDTVPGFLDAKVDGVTIDVVDDKLVVPLPVASTTLPLMDGTGTIGTSGKFADGGHIHPTDTSRQPLLTNPVTGPGSGVTVGHIAAFGDSAGTSIVDGGVIPTATYMVKASAADNSPGFLDGKVDGNSIIVNSSNQLTVPLPPVRTLSTDYTLLPSDTNQVFEATSATTLTCTLPLASSVPKGSWVKFHNIWGEPLFIQGTVNQNSAGIYLPAEQEAIIFSDTANWFTQKNNVVMATSSDPTPGYLSDKVDGTTIEVVNNKLVAVGSSSSQWYTPNITGLTMVNGNTFNMDGDQTSYIFANQRVQAQVTAGLITGAIEWAYTVSPPLQTQCICKWDNGAQLDTGLSKINLGIITGTQGGLPVDPVIVLNSNNFPYTLAATDVNRTFIAYDTNNFTAPSIINFNLSASSYVPGTWIKFRNYNSGDTGGFRSLQLMGVTLNYIQNPMLFFGEEIKITSDGNNWQGTVPTPPLAIYNMGEYSDYWLREKDWRKTVILNQTYVAGNVFELTGPFDNIIVCSGMWVKIINIGLPTVIRAVNNNNILPISGVIDPVLNQYQEIRVETDGTNYYGKVI